MHATNKNQYEYVIFRIRVVVRFTYEATIGFHKETVHIRSEVISVTPILQLLHEEKTTR